MEDTMSKAHSLFVPAILFVLVASLCIANKPDVSYEELREGLKHQLYERQQGIMAQAPYEAFIEPYIKEAEKKLSIPQYLMKNPKNKSAALYFECLLNYNVAYFHGYARSYSGAQKDVAQYEQALLSSIELIKAEGKLQEMDAQAELEKTKEIFARANRRFYKKLGFGVRFFNFFRTLGS